MLSFEIEWAVPLSKYGLEHVVETAILPELLRVLKHLQKPELLSALGAEYHATLDEPALLHFAAVGSTLTVQ